MIVPFPLGGGTDIVARIISVSASDKLGQPIIVDNRPGAGGIGGTDIAAKSTPDGYTIVTVIITHATNPALDKRLPFDSLKDFSSIGLLTKNPQLLAVNATLPVKSVADLIALARSSKESLIFASGGNGTPSHFAAELLRSAANINLLHVPYKGSAPAILDLIAGRVTLNFSSLPSLLNFVKGGRLHALAITGLSRSQLLPDTPTIAESGFPGFEVSAWQGLLAPAGTPASVINALNFATRDALAIPAVREKLVAQGYEPAHTDPHAFNTYLRSEMAKWGKVVRDNGIRAD